MVKRLARWWEFKKMYWIGYIFGRVLTEEQVEKVARLMKK